MAVIDELIREEETGALSFGNFALATKTKKDGFQYQGDSYKIKTFREITKLERNGMFVYESVPGTVVHDFRATDKAVNFVCRIVLPSASSSVIQKVRKALPDIILSHGISAMSEEMRLSL